jgi:CubicO group peptidase (beta-lactamase class C family)
MRRLACAAIAFSLLLTALSAQAQSPARIDALRVVFEAWMKEHGVVKGALVVRARHDASEREYGYGGQDPKQRVLLASLGKAITGQCIGGLIASGRLRFETTVGEALRPFFATHGEPADPRIKGATVAQLLEHRAGFAAAPRDLMTPAAIELLQKRKSPATASLQELLSATLTSPLQSAPGEAFRYSNIGYLALGAIIEVVAGEDY